MKIKHFNDSIFYQMTYCKRPYKNRSYDCCIPHKLKARDTMYKRLAIAPWQIHHGSVLESMIYDYWLNSWKHQMYRTADRSVIKD